MRRIHQRVCVASLLAALLVLRATPVLAQCALCRDAASSAPAETGRALNMAIVGLALAPYLVALAAAWMVHPGLRGRVRREAKRWLGGSMAAR